MKKENLIEVANSFNTFDKMYDLSKLKNMKNVNFYQH